MTQLLRKLRRLTDCSGTNLLEAAMITPLLLVLTFGIIDFGYLFYVYLALENGISQATRFAITGNQMADPNNPSQNLSRADSIMAAMRRATPTLSIADTDFTFNFMSPGSSSWTSGTGGPSDVGKVTVRYTWRPVTPILTPFLTNGRMDISVDSVMKNEARFQ